MYEGLVITLFALLSVQTSHGEIKFECPEPTNKFAPCFISCGFKGASPCTGGQMCCSNGCGQSCQEPVKPGECPYVSPYLRCKTVEGGCTSDRQCPGKEKCCPRACNSPACQAPKESTKPGTCPPIMIGAQTCPNPESTTPIPACISDTACSGDLKCCRRTCMPDGCVQPLYHTTSSSTTETTTTFTTTSSTSVSPDSSDQSSEDEDSKSKDSYRDNSSDGDSHDENSAHDDCSHHK